MYRFRQTRAVSTMRANVSIPVVLVHPDGREQAISGRPGQSLMKAAVGAGVDGIAADCGGTLTCATCHVFVGADWLPRLPAVQADEDAMLDMTADPRRPGSRLSCQIVLQPALAGLRVVLPATQY